MNNGQSWAHASLQRTPQNTGRYYSVQLVAQQQMYLRNCDIQCVCKNQRETGAAPLLLLSENNNHSSDSDWSNRRAAFFLVTPPKKHQHLKEVFYPAQNWDNKAIILSKLTVWSLNVRLRGTLNPYLNCLFGARGVSDLTWSLKAGRPGANGEEPRAVRCDWQS